jgi:hypothetical protein
MQLESALRDTNRVGRGALRIAIDLTPRPSSVDTARHSDQHTSLRQYVNGSPAVTQGQLWMPAWAVAQTA